MILVSLPEVSINSSTLSITGSFANSAAAENFYQIGEEVTMVQRSGTYVLTLDKGVFMLHEGCHDENT